MPSAAFSTSASSKTMTGALPPSSRWTRLRSAAAEPATSMPARTDPVIATICGVVCSTSRRPVSRSPQTTLSTPGGRNSWRELGEQRRAGRRGVARLEDDRVAGRQRRGDLPDHHHQRVVPRRHLADDADRLAADPRGVVLHVLPRRLALEHPGGAGEEPEVVGGVRQLLRHGQAQRLAGVLALDGDELVGARLDGVGDLEQRRGALLRGGVAPGLERLRRRRRRPGRRPRRPTAAPGRRPRRWSGR